MRTYILGRLVSVVVFQGRHVVRRASRCRWRADVDTAVLGHGDPVVLDAAGALRGAVAAPR
ncbi:hypothetical protein [Streptomyces sp. CC228A]|uniref:hypothetical protein n=1 Tax=Streptomyces sp. CC228A TaxID=2898186 RepID=UPI001F336BD9|nr:hypothetical protein [Streptomyces sp. CC228A]